MTVVVIGTRTVSENTALSITNSETTILELSKTECYIVEGYVDLANMASGDTFVFKEYFKVDETNYRLGPTLTLSNAQTDLVLRFHAKTFDDDYKVTGQRTAGSNRNFAFKFYVLDYALV